ncbi:hypothetical protein ACVL91_009613 [Bradyrhizobium elkanii]|jgi:Adenylate and Guanylate cyclase catalytic domain
MTPEPATICLGCWQNLHMPIPLRGPLSAPFRLFGVRPSRMNPNTCTICEMAFSKIMKARAVTIDATILFADLRGYTTLTQTIAQDGLTSLLDAFYDDCAAAIWRYDGILNKTIGDAVFAIFNFPVRRDDHAVQALLAARQIQRSFRDRHDALVRAIGAGDIEIAIGIVSCVNWLSRELTRRKKDGSSVQLCAEAVRDGRLPIANAASTSGRHVRSRPAKMVRGRRQRHMPRIRAPMSIGGARLAGDACAAAARGQVVRSNIGSSRSGMKRVREAYMWRSPLAAWP